MKTLIINADDYGADLYRNRGIFEAVEAGMVTSASILANGPALEDALFRIRSCSRKNVSMGLHLNLSEGRPLTENLRLLVADDGMFRGKGAAHSLFEEATTASLDQELYREITAQIRKLLDQGLRITHLDGHQHVHIFPAVIKIALRAAKDFAIAWIRVPVEEPDGGESDESPAREAGRFQYHAARSRSLIEASSLLMTDHFRGLHLRGKPDLPSLLETVTEGITELMVHPGRGPFDGSTMDFSSFATKDREEELETLLSPEFRQGLKEKDIFLDSFREVTP